MIENPSFFHHRLFRRDADGDSTDSGDSTPADIPLEFGEAFGAPLAERAEVATSALASESAPAPTATSTPIPTPPADLANLAAAAATPLPSNAAGAPDAATADAFSSLLGGASNVDASKIQAVTTTISLGSLAPGQQASGALQLPAFTINTATAPARRRRRGDLYRRADPDW